MGRLLRSCVTLSGWSLAVVAWAPLPEAGGESETRSTTPVAAEQQARAETDPQCRQVAVEDPGTTPEEVIRVWTELAYDREKEQLRARVVSLERELVTLRATSSRLAGELKNLTRSRTSSRRGTLQRSRSRAPTARVTAASPRVQLIGSEALVTGQLRNSGGRDASVYVTVDLLLNQRLYDRKSLSVEVPARSSTPYSCTFPTMLDDGTYSARVEVQY